jgi:site-specific recombinase XerD
MLAAHAATRPDSLLFSSRPGRPLTIRRIRQIVAQHTRAALGQTLTPRDLRTSAIRKMVRDGMPLERVQAAAGLGRTRAAQLYQAFTPRQEAPPDA